MTTSDTQPTTTSDSLYNAKSFGEFWDHYQELHSHPHTRAWHAFATAAALGMFALAVKRRSALLALFAPVVDYAIAQSSHRRHGVKTTPFRKPLWHARAEWRLFRQTLRDAEHRVYERM
jgi:hypothetical protein